MFLLDSLMISGLKWVMNTVVTAAEAEMNDDTALREQLLDAEMRREIGEISDDEFGEIEADILARIREIKERREGGSGPLSMSGAEPIETSEDSRFSVEASVSGDFHEPAVAPHTTVIETEPVGHALAHLVETHGGEQISVLDMEPGDANPTPRKPRTTRTTGTTRTARSSRTKRTTGRKIRS
jgi:gas vesicle protein GvpG